MINLLNRLKKNSRNRLKESRIPDIYSREIFNFLLKRERARADRGHGIFSLVVFDLQEDRQNLSGRQLVEVLGKRIRITDSIGWLRDSSIGVLLADAPNAGGMVFLNDILQSIHGMTPVPECHVYSYPAASEENGDSSIFSTPANEENAARAEDIFTGMLALNPSFWRQLIESFIACVALLLLSPLMLLIAVIIKLTSPGPVLYSQLRIGHKGATFRCFKFRTMHLNVDTSVHEQYFKTLIANGAPMRKLDDRADPRISRVGRLLRSSSLDELPQLFNVVKGEMSFIGPRPALPCEYLNYLPWHRHRIDVLPGLTGLWQVSGKNKTTFTEMMRFDIRYARNKSVGMDLGIVIKTFPLIIRQYLEDRLAGKFPNCNQVSPAADRPLHDDVQELPTLENK
jgi:lipopolysaccharide/colanic/teichoic acid biosynthesis glycosyltransferase